MLSSLDGCKASKFTENCDWAPGWKHLQLARGYFEQVNVMGPEILVKGWMLLQDTAFDSLQAYLNGEPVGAIDLRSRPDVKKAFPWITHADQSGFKFRVRNALNEAQRNYLELIGYKQGRAIARMRSLIDADLDKLVPSPPEALMERVAGTRNPHFFKLGGLKTFGEFVDFIELYRSPSSIRRILDYGCGCGRVMAHFLRHQPSSEMFGCDIDPGAIAWCQDHLPGGSFSTLNPWPPTQYSDQMFDVIVCYSVFTHLSEELQAQWLSEMKRILAPDGLFIASVHGEFAASYALPKESEPFRRFTQAGIFDGMTDPALDGVAPEGYYRSVFRTQAYTLNNWSKYFAIKAYVERGLGNFQDAVVMTQRTSSSASQPPNHNALK
jgi:SAM-dependent methyltransferase